MSDTATRAHRFHLEAQMGAFILREKAALEPTKVVGGDTAPLKPTGKTGPLSGGDAFVASVRRPSRWPFRPLVRLFG